MANVTPSNVVTDSTGPKEYILGNLAFSGTYPTGGEPFDVSQFTFQNKSVPKVAVSVSVAGANGYSVGFIPAATLAGGKLKINTGSAAELSAGAYPAGITGDTFYFCIILKKA